MSATERERLKIFLRVKRGELQQKEAAALFQLRYRYLRQLYQRYCKQRDRGLIHQARGRPSNRAYAAEFNRRCWLVIKSAIPTSEKINTKNKAQAYVKYMRDKIEATKRRAG